MRTIVLVCLVAASCTTACESVNDCFCTKEYVSVTLQVVNEQNEPEAGVEVTVTVDRTGDVLAINQLGAADGYFVVVSDSQKDVIDPVFGSVLTVDGAKEERGFEARFKIGLGHCQCHVYKVWGPDTVVVR